MVELLSRIRASDGQSDTELNEAIFQRHHGRKRRQYPVPSHIPPERLPNYTGSVDAALPLVVSEERSLHLIWEPGQEPFCHLGLPGRAYRASAKTPQHAMLDCWLQDQEALVDG